MILPSSYPEKSEIARLTARMLRERCWETENSPTTMQAEAAMAVQRTRRCASAGAASNAAKTIAKPSQGMK